MTKVLITDPIDQTGIDILSQVAQVDQRIGISNSELESIIHDYDALMIRSGTQVTGDIICLLYTSPSPRDLDLSRMPSSA